MLSVILLFFAPFFGTPYSACEIGNVSYESTICNDEGNYRVFFDLDHVNSGDSFSIVAENIDYGTFAYADLPVFVMNVPGDGEDRIFHFQDIDNPNCTASKNVEGQNCNNNECNISDVTYNIGNCQDNGTFSVFINFQYENTSESFKVYHENNYLGIFDYADLPVELTGFQGNGQTIHLLIKDAEDLTCNVIKEIPGQSCPGGAACELSELVITTLECNPNNQFYVTINFNHENTGTQFKIQGNGHQYGTFNYDELPVTIGPLDGNVNTTYEFVVKDLEDLTCLVDGFITGPYCGNSGECDIYDLAYNTGDCDSAGLYTLHLTFQHENTSQAYKLFIDNQLLGTFEYSQLPLDFTGLTGDGNTHTILVKDAENATCNETISITAPDCDPGGECHISDLELLPLECNLDNQFNVKVNFNHQNTSGEFKIIANGQTFGNFNYNNLPVIIGPFDGNTNSTYHFLVKDLENPDCAEDGNINGPYCQGNNECHISGVNFELSDCDSSGNYYVYFNLEYENTSDTFKVIHQNNILGYFAYSDLPIQLGPLAGDGNTDVFFFQDLLNPNCAKAKEVHSPDCDNNGECDLSELTIFKFECDENNEFNVKINFNHDNTSNHFTVRGNGHNYGTFSYDDLPIIIGPLDGLADINYEFGIKDVENPGCSIDGFITGPYCDENACHLYDISYNLGDCDSSGNYSIYLNCQYQNVSDSFRLEVNNSYYGTYAYADMPVTVGPLAGNGLNVKYLFRDNENGSCDVSKEIKGPNCGQNNECDISELTAIPSNCDEEGNFYVELDFDYINVSDSFKVQGNGIFYGYFSYEDLPIVLGPFDGDSDNSYEFGIKDQLDHDCHAGTSITAPYCENGFTDPVMNLSISNIICIDEHTYFADLDISNDGMANIAVKLWEENTLIGEYMSSSFPLQVTLTNTVQSRVKVNEVETPANFAIGTYEHPECLLATDDLDVSKVRCYPNPAHNGLYLEWPEQQYQYNVFDLTGHIMMSGKAADKKGIDVSKIPSGAYLVQLNNGKTIAIRRFNKI